MTDVPSFDLTAEPWIPVLDLDGRERVLTPLDVVQQADRLATIGGELPTTGYALTRLLLAVLHRAVQGPRDGEHWRHLWEEPRLPVGAVAEYLQHWRDRWDLLHPLTPFLQTAELRTADGKHSGLSKLIADVPNGAPLFTTRAGRSLARMGHAEAARWLVHAQAWDISGIKTGVLDDDRTKKGKLYPLGVSWLGRTGGVLVEGRTLRDTLLLNLLPYRDEELPLGWGRPDGDLPTWERAPLRPGVEPDVFGQPRTRPAGPADLYTWSARRIRLVADEDGVIGVVLTYGDPLAQQNAHTFEPMTAWRRSPTQEKALKQPLVYMPRRHSVERVFWRGLAALLPVAASTWTGREAADFLPPTSLNWLYVAQNQDWLDPALPVRVRIVGVEYGAQDSSVEEIVADQMSSRVAVLRADEGTLGEQAVVAVRRCEEAVKALKNLAGNLVRAAGGDGDGPRARAEEIAFAALDAPFRRWVSGLEPGSDLGEVQRAWQVDIARIVRQLAEELVEQSGPAAWRGRVVLGRHVDAGLADAWFRAALRTALPLAHPDEPSAHPKEAS
ncbi:type I-E CRISPR-associated protein Cse1/CasA [Blastococcus capsensis]|nr:type I-E CRISPR-associated protein Cse1/CasA [Blastococcus capsensis]MDK3256655.1 type I-E CRISPR-associated protein Cse1/CasA [Blastococcus capsensis]